VVKREIAESMSGKFLFHTYGANPMSCAAGRAVLEVVAEEKLQQNAEAVGGELLKRLRKMQQKHDIVGDVRGKGLMLAIELVKDRATKEPATDETARVFEETRHQGLVVSKSGPHRSVLRMVPPLCLAMDDLDQIEAGLDAALSAA
ncbi:MAG: aminotransferase class III-fold pyridoxal phosphate-dependent enzyme, partial [Hyphomicrobiaceae bacterium]